MHNLMGGISIIKRVYFYFSYVYGDFFMRTVFRKAETSFRTTICVYFSILFLFLLHKESFQM